MAHTEVHRRGQFLDSQLCREVFLGIGQGNLDAVRLGV